MPNPVIALAIAVTLTAAATFLFWPDKGLFWLWQRANLTSEHVFIEDALKASFGSEIDGQCPTLENIAGKLNVSANKAVQIVSEMEKRDLLSCRDGHLCLTASGRQYALQIIRAHRLWERHLADETGFSHVDWHREAEHREHLIPPHEADALARQLGNPLFDPHGHPIPTSSGEIAGRKGQPLATASVDQLWRIVRLEDEPDVVYAQLQAEGLHPGMVVRVTETTQRRICFWADLDEHVLAPIVAANVWVVPDPNGQGEERVNGRKLSKLEPGEEGKIVRISRAMPTLERRRLMDLGILPGTLIRAEMPGPVGDPVAYLVRDTLIALRKEQSDQVFVAEEQPVET